MQTNSKTGRARKDFSASAGHAYTQQDIHCFINTTDHRPISVPSLALFFSIKLGDFEIYRLPNVAQFSTTFDLYAQNLDRDELADLFLAQNDFRVPGRYSRYDLGQGVLLRGDGTGNVTAVPASESNILLHGKQCGVVAVDFNDDGQPDLAVSHRSVATWLFLKRKTN